jgi:hypothetical protein
MSTVHDPGTKVITSESGGHAEILLVGDVERTQKPLARLLRLLGSCARSTKVACTLL